MRLHLASPVTVGILLAALNGLLWVALLAQRPPYSDEECRALQLRHEEHAAQELGTFSIVTDQDHLLARRPIHSGWGEPPYTKALILPNFVPLVLSWQIASDAASYYPGPTCRQSYAAAAWFLAAASLQWFLIGAFVSISIRGTVRLLSALSKPAA